MPIEKLLDPNKDYIAKEVDWIKLDDTSTVDQDILPKQDTLSPLQLIKYQSETNVTDVDKFSNFFNLGIILSL